MRLSFFAFPFLLFISGAFAADPITIKIPCDTIPFRTCAELKNILIDGTVAEPKVVGFKGVVRDVMDDIYTGRTKVETPVTPTSGTTTAGSCTTLNLVGKPPICPVLPVFENGCKNESVTNYRNETCPALSQVGQVTTEKYYYTLGKSSSGTRETANVAGGLILALSNQAVGIEKEIVGNALVIAPQSPCYAKARALQTLITTQSEVRLLERVRVCDVSNTETCSTKKYFQANLSTIEAAYMLLARCRLADETTKNFREFALDYPKRIEDAIVKDCFNSNIGRAVQMRSCYAQKYGAWILSRAREAFPNVVAACVGG